VIYVGIDPGEHTGVAVWDSERQAFTDLRTLKLHQALQYVAQLDDAEDIAVIFEDARQRRWFPRERSASEYRGRLMGAGAAKRDAAIWQEFLDDLAIPYEAHSPRPGTTKWNEDYWRKVTGWQGRSSEHSRDAALLVFGRK